MSGELSIPAIPTLPGMATAYAWVEQGKLHLAWAGSILRGPRAFTVIKQSWKNWKTPSIRVVAAGASVTSILKAHRDLGQIVKVVSALPGSGYYVELGGALGRKFPEYRGKSINWFVKHFNAKGTRAEVMEELFEKVCEGHWGGSQYDLVEKMLKEENSMLSTTDTYRQFSTATYLADAWNAMESSDPHGRDSFRRDGTIVDATVVDQVSNVLTVVSDQSIKTKSGKRLMALTPDMGYPGISNDTYRILSVSVDGQGQYTMKLMSDKRMPLLKAGTVLTFMEAPFLSKVFTKASKWSRGEPCRVVRELPEHLAAEL